MVAQSEPVTTVTTSARLHWRSTPAQLANATAEERQKLLRTNIRKGATRCRVARFTSCAPGLALCRESYPKTNESPTGQTTERCRVECGHNQTLSAAIHPPKPSASCHLLCFAGCRTPSEIVESPRNLAAVRRRRRMVETFDHLPSC